MTTYSRGDVVLVPFPFTEQPAKSKRRPALIVSADAYQRACNDVIIAQITSHVSAAPRPGDHPLENWREAGLMAPSLVRAKLTTLHRDLVLRRLGSLTKQDTKAFGKALAFALELRPEASNV
jgi:mRNA interferase MazF